MKKALAHAIACVALGAACLAQDPASRPAAQQDRKLDDQLRLTRLKELIDAAKAVGASGDLKGAIAACDLAVVEFHKEFDRNGGMATAPTLALYKELISFSDGLVDRVETADYEAGIPTRDMLSEKEQSSWGKSPFTAMTRTPGVVTLEGLAIAQANWTGIVSILPPRATPWNDLVIELEFTIVSGVLEMYLRYWPDKKSYLIQMSPKDGFELGKKHAVTIRVKGSTITMAEAGKPEKSDNVLIATSRTGGVGFGLRPGFKVEISKLNLKVLR